MRLLPFILLLAFAVPVVFAETKVTVVVEGLNNPTGVAQQPNGDLFVADSGAGRVVRIVPVASSTGPRFRAQDAIVGSPIDKYGKGPIYDIGPLGLAFLNDKQLVVGDGGYVDGLEYVRVFEVPGRGGEAVKFDAATATIGPLAPTAEIKGEGNFYGVAAIAGQGIYVTCNGDDTKGWIARSVINGTKFGPLERFIATKEATNVDAPVGITVDKAGQLVVGQMGEINVPKDSRLTFYHAKTGKLLLNLETGLYDIAGLAYNPNAKGLLYAVDYAWMAPGEGGLFRLDAQKTNAGQTVKATKVVALDKPTAMCFGTDGALYVTVIGTAKEGDAAKPGKLLKIELDEK